MPNVTKRVSWTPPAMPGPGQGPIDAIVVRCYLANTEVEWKETGAFESFVDFDLEVDETPREYTFAGFVRSEAIEYQAWTISIILVQAPLPLPSNPTVGDP